MLLAPLVDSGGLGQHFRRAVCDGGCSAPVPAKLVATGHMWLLSSYKVADGTVGSKAAHPMSADGLPRVGNNGQMNGPES